MAFSWCGDCLGTWSSLELWMQAESLWESDAVGAQFDEPEDEFDVSVISPYWPGSLRGPW